MNITPEEVSNVFQKYNADIIWIERDFIEGRNEIVFLLLEFSKESSYSIDNLIFALKQSSDSANNEQSVRIHLDLIKDFGNAGVSAYKAGKALRKEIEKQSLKNKGINFETT